MNCLILNRSLIMGRGFNPKKEGQVLLSVLKEGECRQGLVLTQALEVSAKLKGGGGGSRGGAGVGGEGTQCFHPLKDYPVFEVGRGGGVGAQKVINNYP